MEDKKVYTEEELAELEAKAARYDRARRLRSRLLIGAGVAVGMFAAGYFNTVVNSDEAKAAMESNEESDDQSDEIDILVDSSDDADVTVDIIESE